MQEGKNIGSNLTKFARRTVINFLKEPNLFADTDLCVKCGLCVPHCPTYRQTQDENESPRGRIALIQAWAKGSLDATPALQKHIDHCLLCRTCESVCPAQVPYSKLVDRFRSEVYKTNPPSLARIRSSFYSAILSNKRLGKITANVAESIRSTKLFPFLSKVVPVPFSISNLLQDFSAGQARKSLYPASNPRLGQLDLFVGCTGELFDSATLHAGIRILNHLGFDVRINRNQVCCGALYLHSGDSFKARELAVKNIRAYESCDDPILFIATGCGVMLKDYPSYFDSSEKFSSRVTEICNFLIENTAFDQLDLGPLSHDILIHNPCSLANVLKTAVAPKKLVEAIPKARISLLNNSIRCCGAAGNYMLEHPQMAAAVRHELIDVITAAKPNHLVTTNIGCALHIRAGLREQGQATEVVHPLVLIDRQLNYSRMSGV